MFFNCVNMVKIFVLLAIASLAQGKLYTDCGSKLASLQSVHVSGCSDDASECVLHRNSNVTFDIEFNANSVVQSVTTVVHGIIMALPVPFAVPQPDACVDSGLSCPLQASTNYKYTATLPVLKAYPKVSVTVKWELKNENEENLVCIEIPARLK